MNKNRKLSLKKEAKQLYKAWIKQALSDFEVAKITFKAEAYDWTTFSCQQTLEKLFKGIYLLKKIKFPPHTHDLFRLHKQIKPQLNLVKTDQYLKDLTKCYIASRYPEVRMEDERFDRLLNQTYASKLFNFTKRVLQWYIKKINYKN